MAKKGGGDDGPWANISDMMTGLMLMFMFITVVYLSRVEAKQQAIEDETNKYEQVEEAIIDNLEEELKEDLVKWNAEILEDGTVRFNDPEVHFSPGSSVIKNEFKEILDDFFPRYISILAQYQDEISEIRIEGHTSSDWGAATDLETRYLSNAELSQQRSFSILKHVFLMDTVFDQKPWLTEKIRANGLAFSKPILDESGNEDKIKSKRVEFKIEINSKDVLKKIIDKLK